MADEIQSSGLSNIIERRFYADVELRVDDTEEGGITGYAAVFDKWSEDLGFFKEKIEKGAFARSIKDHDIRALINHDPNLLLGRNKNKTLKLWEDDKGLGYDVKLPDTSYANDLKESIRRKDITQNSFGFQTVQDEWSKDGKRRTLLEVKLFDISPVTFPAYKQTSVKLREQFGIDFDAFNAAWIRANRGISCEADMEIFNEIIEVANRLKPTIADPLEEHSAPEPDPALNATLIRGRSANMAIKNIILHWKE